MMGFVQICQSNYTIEFMFDKYFDFVFIWFDFILFKFSAHK